MKSLHQGIVLLAVASLLASLLAACPPPPKAVAPAYVDELDELEAAGGPTVKPTTLIDDGTKITSFTLTGQAVFFTTPNSVARYDRKDGTITVVADGEHSPRCLTTDESSLYWCEHAAGAIKRLPLGEEGAAVATVAEGLQRPSGLVLDGDMIYVAESVDEGTIVAIPAQGGERTVLASGQKLPVVTASDRHRVYWVSRVRGRSTIMAIAKTGGEAVTLAKDQQIPHAMAIDDDKAYWTSTESILSVPLAGGKVTTLAEGQANPQGLVANIDGLAWTNGDDGSVWSLKKGAKEPEVVSPFEGLPALLKAYGDSLYWTDESPPRLRAIKYP